MSKRRPSPYVRCMQRLYTDSPWLRTIRKARYGLKSHPCHGSRQAQRALFYRFETTRLRTRIDTRHELREWLNSRFESESFHAWSQSRDMGMAFHFAWLLVNAPLAPVVAILRISQRRLTRLRAARDEWRPGVGWLRLLLPRRKQDEIIGDLLELYDEGLRPTLSPRLARLAWWRHALSAVLAEIHWSKILRLIGAATLLKKMDG